MAAQFACEYRLPASVSLLGESELDAEERAAFSPLLPVRPSRPTPRLTASQSWASIAAGPAAALRSSTPVAAAPTKSVPKDADWHLIPIAKLTPELKRDLVLLENRAHLDPKRFYKSTGTGRKRGELPERVHVGIVVEAPHEYLSGRLTNNQRKKSFADEIFSDPRLVANAKKRFDSLQQSRSGNKRYVDPAARAINKRARRGHRRR
jgi:Fcf2 pre-rRNA processing